MAFIADALARVKPSATIAVTTTIPNVTATTIVRSGIELPSRYCKRG